MLAFLCSVEKQEAVQVLRNYISTDTNVDNNDSIIKVSRRTKDCVKMRSGCIVSALPRC